MVHTTVHGRGAHGALVGARGDLGADGALGAHRVLEAHGAH